MAFGALRKLKGELTSNDTLLSYTSNRNTSSDNELPTPPSPQKASDDTRLQTPTLSQLTRQSIQQDLARLARFGANITDAHSCFIFLESRIFAATSQNARRNPLILVGHHTLSTNIKIDAEIDLQAGFLGWVLKNNRALHISPFERDSRSLGVYTRNEKLKSLLAVPLRVETENFGRVQGIVFCDSKKSFSFSKLHQKLLNDLTREIANTTELHLQKENSKSEHCYNWDEFYTEALRLQDHIGMSSLELIRIQFSNLHELQKNSLLPDFFERTQSLQRLIRQSIPEAYPIITLPSGDVLVLVDRMFSSLLTGRISAIVEKERDNWGKLHSQTAPGDSEASVRISTRRLKKGVFRQVHFEESLQNAWRGTHEQSPSTLEISLA